MIEAVCQPLYIWMFGLTAYGIYVVLWGAVNLLTNLIGLSMTSALQRLVPMQRQEEQAHAAVKLALLVSVVPALVIALLVSVYAEHVAELFSVAPGERGRLPHMIALFAWALPLWTFVAIATAAARARRAFGPEIRIRIFWEQLARVIFAVAAFALGFHGDGLIVAHLGSLALAAILCVGLLGRFYRLRLLARVRVGGPLARNVMVTGIGLLPSDLSRRMLIDAPPVVLNMLLPGAQGAAAAGLFEVGRKLSTVPYIVRQSFQYVLAPLSSLQASSDRVAIGPLYHFASRVSMALVVPFAALMTFAAPDILRVYPSEAAAALSILVVLLFARACEALVGPANAIVEMIGHRMLPTLNSTIAIVLWAVLAAVLTPRLAGLGMAIAVAAATIVLAYAAMAELWWSDGVAPFDGTFVRGLAVALLGVLAMAAIDRLVEGPLRLAALLPIWSVTTWMALRYGLALEDREGLGGFARKLRLVSDATLE